MATEKLEDLTPQQLKSRRKTVLILLVMLGVAAVGSGLIFIYDLITERGFDSSLFVGVMSCSFMFIFFYSRLKKLNQLTAQKDN